MPASFPTSAKTFTTKSDGAGNTILAAHINDLQAEVTAIEQCLLGTTSFNLVVGGTTTLTGALAANGGITVDSTAFTVADTTGVVTGGTYNGQTINAAANFTGTITAAGNITSSAGLLGMLVPSAGAYTAADTTPTVLNVGYLNIANASPCTITDFDDQVERQVIILRFADANTTITTANAALSGGASFVSSANDILVLISIGGLWTEMCRSVNA